MVACVCAHGSIAWGVRHPWLVLCVWLAAIPARGQFYAPETDFHDLCQRRFPVEAARVLAWIRNAEGAHIADVTYRVETRASETAWSIEWRDKAQVVMRKANVNYSKDALLTGAQWYRDIWRQLEGTDWSLPNKTGGAVSAAFWKGAESAGLSRMEGVTAALKQIADTPPLTAAGSAQLAGTLAQTALPMVGMTVTLDATMLARAAAWLCAAEQRAGGDSPTVWGPILSLAGRDAAAREIWSSGMRPKQSSATERFWDVLIRLPAPSEALTFIARPENRQYAAPLFFAYAKIDSQHAELFLDVGPKLYPPDAWKRLHDYGPSLNHASNNRQPIAQDFPARSFRAWIDVLRELTPLAGDSEGVSEKAGQAKDYDGGRADLAAPSTELARILNDGSQNSGPLLPVAVVTARDLLGFGWEFGGLQLGALHTRFSILAKGRETSQALEKGWFGAIEGWEVFTQNLKSPPFKPLEDTTRYECIVASRVAAALIEHPPTAWTEQTEAASVYFRRRWLMDPHRALEFLIDHGGRPPLADELLTRCMREGGQRNLAGLLTDDDHFMYSPVHRDQWRFDEAIDALKLREKLAEAVPLSIAGRRSLIDQKFADRSDPFGYAQALERLHWEQGIAFAPQTVFLYYVRANAPESAKRFYDRWHDAMSDRYKFQTTLGSANLALAILEKDAPRIQQALADCGSTTSRQAEIAAALLRDDINEARKQIDAWIKQWPKGRGQENYLKLREYLALIPALNDLHHADHECALDAFPKTPSFLFLQWVLSEKARLSAAEAERFLGGGEADAETQIVIAALQKNRETFEQRYQELVGPRPDPSGVMLWPETARRLEDAKAVLYAWLRNQLLPVAPPKAQPDLRPANASPLLPNLRGVAVVVGK